jgi:hypothetical protein
VSSTRTPTGVRVPQLVRREAEAHAGVGGQLPEGGTGGRA